MDGAAKVGAQLTDSPEALLKRYFGYDGFRPNQAEIVDAVLAGRDVLAVMPTGAGKSVCYQVPALALDGWTLVVSPLISLMKDQVTALSQAGIPAAFINSALTPSQRSQVLQRAEQGAYKLLYVAPERLDAGTFASFCKRQPPALVAIDEAHCISQWGQDFRPSYTRINDFLDGLPQRPPVCAFTATATPAVRSDILQVLDLHNPFQVVADFDRPNLHFAVERPSSKKRALLAACQSHSGQCGIVYCTSRKSVEELCDALCDAGVPATRYHAGLSADERRRNQDDFLFDRADVMVATNAFGMGIDKSNVAFVIHYNMPLDVESYYQEAGRAGRDGEAAECLLLYAPKDVRTDEFLINAGYDENADIDGPLRAELRARAMERLKQMTFYSTTQDCLRGFLLRYFGQDAPMRCDHCGNCETQFEQRDVTVDAQKVISCVYRLAERDRTMGKTAVVDILRGSKAVKIVGSGFDTLSTYGIMADDSAHYVRFILDMLIEQGLLAFSGGDYPVVHATAESADFLRERRTLQVKVPKEQPRPEARTKKRAAAERLAAESGDPALFGVLKDLRTEISNEENVPAYVVFSNHTLHDMVRINPQTEDEFLEVSGVGQVKAERYGERFLSCLREYAAENQ